MLLSYVPMTRYTIQISMALLLLCRVKYLIVGAYYKHHACEKEHLYESSDYLKTRVVRIRSPTDAHRTLVNAEVRPNTVARSVAIV